MGSIGADAAPTDRSWLAYTDCDLLATKVSGSLELIAALEADEELEILRLESEERPRG